MPSFKDKYGREIRLGHILGYDDGYGEVIERPSGEWVFQPLIEWKRTIHSCNFPEMIIVGHKDTWEYQQRMTRERDELRQRLSDHREMCAEKARDAMEFLEHRNTLTEYQNAVVDRKLQKKGVDVWQAFEPCGKPLEEALKHVEEELEKTIEEAIHGK